MNKLENKVNQKELRKAISEYKKYNKNHYSAEYGILMYDYNDDTIWTDYFYSLGRNSWNVYQEKSIINLGSILNMAGYDITVDKVNFFINNELYKKYL